MHHNNQPHESHIPVLLAPVLALVDPQPGERYLDLTAGYGGHAGAILSKTGTSAQAVLVDRDDHAVQVLSEQLPRATLRHQDFLAASQELVAAGERFDIVLADLGVSSKHLNDGNRGFSFLTKAPLDMRMDQRQELTAETVVNTWSQSDLRRMLTDFGEEPKAAQIAQLMIAARPIRTTVQLAEIVKRAWPGHSRVHPATRTFQAIRIAVNQELQMLEASLPLWQQLLAPGGTWQGSSLAPGGEWALLGTTMSPGFHLDDFELGDRDELLRRYPQAREEILRLTRLGQP